MEDWIDIIRQRLQEAETPLPPGDWEAFEASVPPAKRPRVLPWVISALAAAAVAAVLLIPRPEEESALEQPLASVERVEPEAPVTIAEALPSDSPVRPSAAPSKPVVRKPTAVPAAPTQVYAEEPVPQNPVSAQEPDATEEVLDEPVAEPTVSQEAQSDEETEWKDVFDSEQPSDATSGYRIVFSPHIGSTGSRSRSSVHNPVYVSESWAHAGGAFFESDPYYLSLETFPMRHSLPLSFGLEISYFPSSRVALTSGLDLSIYNSVRTVRTLEMRQRVHYLGIPLKAEWVAWQAGRFSTWLGAGGKVDRCIRARIGDQSVQDNTFHWSVMADASLQYALTEHLGLYVQPEVSWYFKPTHPVLQTYRTEHPFMFTVGAGLRIGF